MTAAQFRKMQPFDLFDIQMADEFQQSLWLVDRHSLKNHRVDLPGQALMCRWLPDGALLVLVVAAGRGWGARQLRAGLCYGSGQWRSGATDLWHDPLRLLFQRAGVDPRWQILFVSSLRPDWHKDPFNTEIYALDTVTRQVTCLTNRHGVDLDPKLSPNGDWIACRGFDDNGEFHGNPALYLMRPDGSGATCLADVGQGIGNHVWADDGQGLYVTYVRDAAHRLAYVDLKGTVTEIASGLAQAGALEV